MGYACRCAAALAHVYKTLAADAARNGGVGCPWALLAAVAAALAHVYKTLAAVAAALAHVYKTLAAVAAF